MVQAGGRHSGGRILILEDDHLFAESIALFLEDHQLTPVGPFARSAEATQALDRGEVDAAILDLQLGAGEDSLAIAGRLLALSIPFLFLTGSPDRVPGPLQAQVPVLSKSCRPEALLAVIEQLLERTGDRRFTRHVPFG